MPKALEKKLKTEAEAKGYSGKRADAYVYGTLRRITNWEPNQKKKKKQ
jgi:hypothetical protein